MAFLTLRQKIQQKIADRANALGSNGEAMAKTWARLFTLQTLDATRKVVDESKLPIVPEEYATAWVFAGTCFSVIIDGYPLSLRLGQQLDDKRVVDALRSGGQRCIPIAPTMSAEERAKLLEPVVHEHPHHPRVRRHKHDGAMP